MPKTNAVIHLFISTNSIAADLKTILFVRSIPTLMEFNSSHFKPLEPLSLGGLGLIPTRARLYIIWLSAPHVCLFFHLYDGAGGQKINVKPTSSGAVDWLRDL